MSPWRITFWSLVATSFMAAMMALSFPARPAEMCLPREKLVAAFERQGKKQVVLGLMTGSAAVIELYTDDAGKWVLIVAGTNGVACVLAGGDGLTTIVLEKGKAT